MTTLEAVNRTGTLVVLPDDFDHISVRPTVDYDKFLTQRMGCNKAACLG